VAVSSATGIGASGVVYAIFGFMWLTRERYPRFSEILDARTIQIFLLWLVGCMVASAIDAADIGNAAHVSGLAFGAGVAAVFVLRWKRTLTFAGLIALVGVAVMTLFWCPWSATWQGYKAYVAHEAGRYDEAVARYTEAIRLEPDNAWAYEGRSIVYQSMKEPSKAEADMKKAIELDPSLKEQTPEEGGGEEAP
jgi:GlpG protein